MANAIASPSRAVVRAPPNIKALVEACRITVALSLIVSMRSAPPGGGSPDVTTTD